MTVLRPHAAKERGRAWWWSEIKRPDGSTREVPGYVGAETKAAALRKAAEWIAKAETTPIGGP